MLGMVSRNSSRSIGTIDVGGLMSSAANIRVARCASRTAVVRSQREVPRMPLGGRRVLILRMPLPRPLHCFRPDRRIAGGLRTRGRCDNT